MQQFPVGRGLWPDLPEDEEQFLDLVVTTGHHEPDDGHEEVGQPLATQYQLDQLLEGRRLDTSVTMLCV